MNREAESMRRGGKEVDRRHQQDIVTGPFGGVLVALAGISFEKTALRLILR
jgi:hypothetical protein